jgi:hypothetical protein
MSLIYQLPPNTNYLTPTQRFDAVFNNPTVNRYDFGKAANTNVDFLPIKRQNLYLFDRRSFSASMDEGVYLKAISQQPVIYLRIREQRNQSIYPRPLPMINYVDGLESIAWAYAEQDATITITFDGVLIQPIELIGELNIYTQFAADVYEIRNRDWIKNFMKRTRDGQAQNLIGQA